MDRLVVAISPLLKIAAIIGVLCGLALIALGGAWTMEMIDMGRETDEMDPAIMISGGIGLVVIFLIQYFILRYFVNAAKARLAK